MAEDKFKYDPEGEDQNSAKATRLPFGICKAHGIPIQDWWSPRDAWEALKNHGIVREVSDEYRKYYLDKKKEADKARRKQKKERANQIAAQEAMPEHVSDPNYTHKNGAIAGADKSAPMSFEQADGGHCNPYYNKGLIGYATNCQTCVAVYVARRQGYNVRALPNLNNKDIRDLSMNVTLAYVDENGNRPSLNEKPRGKNTLSWIDSNVKEGEIHAIRGRWKGSTSGHIIVVEREGGAIRVYDPQTNTKYTAEEAQRHFFSQWKNTRMMNLTNAKMNEGFCDKIMKGELTNG